MYHIQPCHLPHHYSMLCAWWTGHGWPTLPASIIPPCAFLAYHRDDHTGVDTNHAFACAYLDSGGTGLAMMEWLTTNPENSARESVRALNHLLPFMRNHLLEKGYHNILAVCRQPSLSRLLVKHGYPQTDEGVTHHMAVLDA